MKYKDFDFGRAKDLMSFIVEAGKHGPTYNVLAGMAQEELKDMVEEAGLMVKRMRDVTPPAGPANAAIAESRELRPQTAEPYVMKDPQQAVRPSDRLTEEEISRLRTDPGEQVRDANAPTVRPPYNDGADTPAQELDRRPV